MRNGTLGFALAMGLGVVTLLPVPSAHALIGQVCTSDATCPSGYMCDKENGERTVPPSSNPGRQPVTTPKPVTHTTSTVTTTVPATTTTTPATGVCAPSPKSCVADSDCGVDSACSTPPSKACPDGVSCPETQPTLGTCKPVMRTCAAAADCPAPLVCKSSGQECRGGAGETQLPDGGIVTTLIPTECTPLPAVCTWVLVECKTATGCAQTDEECVDAGWMQADCTESCDTEWCTQVCVPGPLTGSGACFPKRVDCNAGQACPVGSSCVDFAGIDDGLPPWWTNGTAMKACLPDGLRMVFEEKADGDSSAVDGLAGGTSEGAGTTVGKKTENPPTTSTITSTQATTNIPTTTSSPTTSDTAKPKDEGCSLGGGDSTVAVLLASLALLGFCRTRRSHR